MPVTDVHHDGDTRTLTIVAEFAAPPERVLIGGVEGVEHVENRDAWERDAPERRKPIEA